MGDFWIETFQVARSSLAGTSNVPTNFNLDKPGRFVGGCTSIDAFLAVASSDDVVAFLTNTDDSELVYGDAITAIRMNLYNSAGAARVFGARVCIFVKK